MYHRVIHNTQFGVKAGKKYIVHFRGLQNSAVLVMTIKCCDRFLFKLIYANVTNAFIVFNTLRPMQNCRHFADIFKCIYLNENVWIWIEISMKFVPNVRINIIPTVVQIIAWRLSGDKPLSGPMMASFWRIYASLGLNEWTLLVPTPEYFEMIKLITWLLALAMNNISWWVFFLFCFVFVCFGLCF